MKLIEINITLVECIKVLFPIPCNSTSHIHQNFIKGLSNSIESPFALSMVLFISKLFDKNIICQTKKGRNAIMLVSSSK